MRNTENNSILIWRRRAARLLAVFFVLYAIADISVLQQYCGNEALGIPPYTGQVEAVNQKINDASGDLLTGSAMSCSSHEEDRPDSPRTEEGCFGCCSHILIGLRATAARSQKSAVKNSAANFSAKHLQSDRHLPRYYQPPKSA